MPNWLFGLMTHLNILLTVPSSKVVSKIADKPVSSYWGTAGSQGDAERNAIEFYYGLSPYMKMVYPIGGILREVITWFVGMLYSFDMFLMKFYVHAFDLLGVGSDTSLHHASYVGGEFALWYHWGIYAGLSFMVLALLFYFCKMILAPNGTAFEYVKHGIWTCVVVSAVVAGFPWFTGVITNGVGQFAKNVFHTEDVTSGNMVDKVFYEHVYSIPHLLMDKSAGNHITENGSGIDNDGGSHIRYVPGSQMSKDVTAKQLIVNLEGMSPTKQGGQNRWNGLRETSIPVFLQNYASDDDVLDEHGLDDISGQSSKVINKNHHKMAKSKRNDLKGHYDDKSKATKANNAQQADEGHSKWDVPRDLGYMFHGMKKDYDNTGSGWHKYLLEHIDNHPMMSGGYTTKSLRLPVVYSTNNNSLLSYKLAGSGDNTRLVHMDMSDDATHSIHKFYAMYRVDWTDIILQLVLIAFVFGAFIIKVVQTAFKSAVMYVTIGLVAYKGLSSPEKWKQYIRNYFNLFEMLILDIIIIIMWFDFSNFTNSMVSFFMIKMNTPNGVVCGLLQALCDYALALVCINGIPRISDILGAPTGSSHGWAAFMGSMMALRGGYNLGKNGIGLAKNGATKVGHGISHVGNGISKGAGGIKKGVAKHKIGMGPLQRAKRAAKARKANGDGLKDKAHNLLNHNNHKHHQAKKASNTGGTKANAKNGEKSANNPSNKNGASQNSNVANREGKAKADEAKKQAKANSNSGKLDSSKNGNKSDNTNPTKDDRVKGSNGNLTNSDDNSNSDSGNSGNGNDSGSSDTGTNDSTNGNNTDDNSDNSNNANQNDNDNGQDVANQGSQMFNPVAKHNPKPSNTDQKDKSQKQLNDNARKHKKQNPVKSNAVKNGGHNKLKHNRPSMNRHNNSGLTDATKSINGNENADTLGTATLNGIQHTGNGISHIGNGITRAVGGQPTNVNHVNHGYDNNLDGSVGNATNGSTGRGYNQIANDSGNNNTPTNNGNNGNNGSNGNGGSKTVSDVDGSHKITNQNTGNGGTASNNPTQNVHQPINHGGSTGNGLVHQNNNGNTPNFTNNQPNTNSINGQDEAMTTTGNGGGNQVNTGSGNVNTNPTNNDGAIQNFGSMIGLKPSQMSTYTPNTTTDDVSGNNTTTTNNVGGGSNNGNQFTPSGNTGTHNITQHVDDGTSVVNDNATTSPTGHMINHHHRPNVHITRVHDHHTVVNHHIKNGTHKIDNNLGTFGYSIKHHHHSSKNNDIDFTKFLKHHDDK